MTQGALAVGGCRDWIAWLDLMPGHRPVLHVTGTCAFPRPGFAVELRRPAPAESGPSAPAIRGPVWLDRASGPPVFRLDPGAYPFVAVELATRPELFDRAGHGHERQPTNFHATWQEAPLFAAPTFTPRPEVWARLKGASQLYYRLWASTSSRQWITPQVTTPDGAFHTAPVIVISDGPISDGPISDGPLGSPSEGPEGAGEPRTLVLAKLVREPAGAAGPGPHEPAEVAVRYSEPTDTPYQTIRILPDGVSIPVQDVF